MESASVLFLCPLVTPHSRTVPVVVTVALHCAPSQNAGLGCATVRHPCAQGHHSQVWGQPQRGRLGVTEDGPVLPCSDSLGVHGDSRTVTHGATPGSGGPSASRCTVTQPTHVRPPASHAASRRGVPRSPAPSPRSGHTRNRSR